MSGISRNAIASLPSALLVFCLTSCFSLAITVEEERRQLYPPDTQLCHELEGDKAAPQFVIDGGFIILIIAVLYALWAISYVCEDFFVPALEVLCKVNQIPDSVAGAIVMAAGNDAPELFISLLGLFVEKSALGVGTVIGSEIFNHMCITAGSCLYAKEGKLKVQPLEFTRDCAGYLSSLVALMLLCGADLSRAFDKSNRTNCIAITIGSCCILIEFQVIYCIVVANFKKICRYFGIQDEIRNNTGSISTTLAKMDLNANVEAANVFLGADMRMNVGVTTDKYRSMRYRGSSLSRQHTTVNSGRYSSSEKESQSTNNPLLESEVELRQGVETAGKQDRKFIQSEPLQSTTANHHSHTNPSKPETMRGYIIYGLFRLVEWSTTPFRYLIYHSMYDTSMKENEEKYAYTCGICILWMGFWAYILCTCMTYLGSWLGISSAIMGLTFSAIGTSFSNFWSSLVVAKNGQGDMAISNALGSNTFNIYICLGIPWLLYTMLIGTYAGLQDGGIVLLLILLVVALVIYYAVIYFYDFTLYRWMAYPCILMYVVIITLAVTV